MDRHQLIERVMALTGLRDVQAAARLLRISMAALGACLPPPDRERWASRLPEELRDVLLRATYDRALGAAQVYHAVQRAEGVELPFGAEHAQGAIRALASCLDAEAAALLSRHLPEELAELLHDPTRGQGRVSTTHPPVAAARPQGGIASGAGGSTHPVSVARPGEPQAGSVGDWSDERAEHTLGRGAEPIPDDTLATSKPGSKRSLGDAKR